ncbi:MAG: hypothetical protein R3324_16545, partial [Halobacteriales archaeon]|nr:hypothetical protein [Halobacteriales archaeon]
MGAAFVMLSLAYNLAVVGDPVTFPYEVFGPRDGIGFGRRELLGYAVRYTPWLALEATAHALWELATRWTAAGPAGTILALLGVVRSFRSARSTDTVESLRTLGPIGVRVLLVGLAVSIVAGNLYFWGTLNALGDIADPLDGLADLFGPFYHFDLLLPLSVFGAGGLAWVAGVVRRSIARRTTSGGTRLVLIVLLVTGVCVGAVAETAALGPPIDRHQSYTDRYERAYEPLEATEFEHALVFLPTPYGPWLGHPFQDLRNRPSLDGPVVYAIDRALDSNLVVVEQYPERQLYRYRFHGRWLAVPDGSVVGTLERIDVRRGRSFGAETRVGIPDNVDRARIRVETANGSITHGV